jgi:predicted DNA binding CopG/RHH family protein
MTNTHKIPKFETEAEEAQWWFDHREETALWMETAAQEGRTTSLAAILQNRQQTGATPTVSIRIDPSDISRARMLAQRRGLRYQTYLKMLLHEALEKEDQRLAG